MKRDAMVFPFRWVDSLLELESDLPVMLVAIREYAENGTEPNFKGAMAGLWREYKDRIDNYNEWYDHVCEVRRQAGKMGAEFGKLGGRPRKGQKPQEGLTETAKTPKGVLETAKTPKEKEKVKAKDIEKESVLTDAKEKPDASAPYSFFDRQPKERTLIKSFMKAADFSKWGETEFRASVAKAVKDHPEYAADVEDFARYWLEPDKTGKPRFALQKTWATGGRLATWHQRSMNDRNGKGRQPLNAAGEGEWRI